MTTRRSEVRLTAASDRDDQSRRGRGSRVDRVHRGAARAGPATKTWRDTSAGDRGAATIFVLAIGLVLVGAGMAGAAVGAARVARHQAHTAADFGALAGAARVFEGEPAACAAAARIVAANGATLVSCEVQQLDVVVRVEVTTRFLPGPATAAARAGPVSTPVE